MDRIATANAVLTLMGTTTRIERRRGGWWILWTDYRGTPHARRWQTQKGSDVYPVWYRIWGHGGTCCTALSQLVRWCSGKPVLPLGTWRYWCSPVVFLGQNAGPQIVETLQSGGYPVDSPCVLCGVPVKGTYDWWSLDGVSGPCCGWTTGCRQKGA